MVVNPLLFRKKRIAGRTYSKAIRVVFSTGHVDSHQSRFPASEIFSSVRDCPINFLKSVDPGSCREKGCRRSKCGSQNFRRGPRVVNGVKYTMHRTLSVVLVLAVTVFFAGCGKASRGLKVEYVEGVVTYDGAPVEGAHVTFYPSGSGGEAAGGVTDSAGVYKLTSESGDIDKGAIAGTYKVTVRKVESKGFLNDDGTIAPGAPKSPTTGQYLTTVQTDLLPKPFSMISMTPLELKVEPGKNKLDINLDNM